MLNANRCGQTWHVGELRDNTTANTLYDNNSVEHIAQDHTCGPVSGPMRRGLSLDYVVESTTNPQGVARNANQQAPFGIIDPHPPMIRHAALLDGILLRDSMHCIDWDMMVVHQLRTNNRHGP